MDYGLDMSGHLALAARPRACSYGSVQSAADSTW